MFVHRIFITIQHVFEFVGKAQFGAEIVKDFFFKFRPNLPALNGWTVRLYKTFFVFHQNLMKLDDEVLVHIKHYNITKFQKIQMKNKTSFI